MKGESRFSIADSMVSEESHVNCSRIVLRVNDNNAPQGKVWKVCV